MVSVVLVGECVALVLALVPGGQGDRWVYFGLASLMIQWIVLLSVGFAVFARGEGRFAKYV